MTRRRILGALFWLAAASFAFPLGRTDLEKRKDVIRYGIESEILELVSTLQTEKDDRLNEDLAAMLADTRSPKLRDAVFRFFAAREWGGAGSEALGIVDRRDQESVSSVLAALSYLSAVKSSEGIPEAREILTGQETKYMSAAVHLLGRAGGSEESEVLMALFDSEQTPDSLKQDAIRALGEIKAQAAVDRLVAILEDESSGKATRMYAADALGKIGDPKAVPALVKAANGEDPQVRSSAITSLGAFPGAEAESAIVQGIRDGVPGVRIAAIRSSASLSIREAEAYIRYRARNDPERKVREESVKALGIYGGNSDFLLDILRNKKADAALRAASFTVLLEKGGSRGELDKALAEESAGKDTTMYKALLRSLSQTGEKSAAPLVETYLLKSPDFTARIAGIDWARRNRAAVLRAVVSDLAENDKVESVRKRAASALEEM